MCVVFVVVVVDTGTVVMVLFTCDAELFLAVVFLSAMGELGSGRERRVSPFPSGLLFGEFDL
jgi:hypothetical protein